nr:recombinase family protein [Streptomyces sp. Root431]
MYARQSKARPDSSDSSPEAQVAAGAAPAESRGWEVVHTLKDVGRSSGDPHVIHPSSADLMSAVRAGEVDVVVVDELSRPPRKGAHDALEIDKDFKRYGVRFVSVLEPFPDTSNAIGVVTFALIAALAKQDSDIKAERLRGASARMPTTTSLDEYGHGLSTPGTPSPNYRPTARPVLTEAATNWPCGGRR